MRKSLCRIRLPFLLSAALLSQHSFGADLLQVYRDALANDAQFASARASLAAGQERAPQGLAGLLPTIGATGSYTRNEAQPYGKFNSTNYALTLTQPLLRWANWEQYEQGKLSGAVSEAQFAQAQQDLIVRTAQAYFDVLAAQDNIVFIQAQKAAITEQLAFAKRNFEVGTATITDTHEAQARYDLVVAQEIAALSDLDIKRSALEQIIGHPADELEPLKPGLALPLPQPAEMAPWVASAEKQNYNVVAQQLAVEIARREIKKNRAGHTPTVDLVASRSHAGQYGSLSSISGLSSFGGLPAGVSGFPTSTSTNNTAVGVQVNIPLFAGFGVTSRVREAIAQEDKARSDYEFARRTAVQNARQSFLAVNSALSQVKALQAAEVSSQSALASNRLGYEVGIRINIDVLNAQQQLFSTRRDLAKARYDTLMHGLRLKAAAGSLSETDVVQVNTLLQ